MAIESKRGKKTSSEKVAEVISKKIENPDLSLRDISKETGINHQTVSDIQKKEMNGLLTSSDRAGQILEKSLEIVYDGIDIIAQEVKAIKGNTGALKINTMNDLKQLSGTIEENFKRSQLLQNKPTDNIQINDFKSLSTEELLARKNKQK